MQATFVHLRLHTEYSIVDGLVRLDPLLEVLPQRGMNAVAITDVSNLFATVKFYKAAFAAGIKPIIGCEVSCLGADALSLESSLVLLCQNEQGYRHLTRLVSKAYQEGQQLGKPTVTLQWVADHAEGLIALSGGRFGDIGQALLQNDEATALSRATIWMTMFPGRFYLEIQRSDRSDEAIYNERVCHLAEALALPLVATNDVRFLNEDDFDAHEARVCIHEGYALSDPRRKARYSRKQYVRSAAEMAVLFQDLPEALQNTVEISKRCTVTLELGHNYLPNFKTPNGASVEEYLAHLAKEGLEVRFQKIVLRSEAVVRDPYEDRLALELKVIQSMGFASYFLIVADFIQWAKDNGVPVGPGRGSGAGSLVAYVLGITDLDPLQYELLFERFLNPERISMPDFDIDFCMEGRDRVIEYVAQKYGRQSVSQIITFGTMAAKAVVRDVGRVFGHPYGFVDKLAKLIPFEIGMTLEKALVQEKELQRRYQDEEEVKELLDLARKLEGITRNAGKHAGGVVIAPSELTDFTAIYCEAGSNQLLSQFDKDDVEAVGLVKFDFLGLRTLTIIHWALITVNRARLAATLLPIDITEIPTDDPLTFSLLNACQTTAVFQLESRGMKELIHRMQPDSFEEIIALVALFRPGPLQSGMVDDFIDRKHKRAAVVYLHPLLEPILKPTYGVILYQEQVMQIAQVLANYTLGAADLLRRAMGKKKPEEMAEQRQIFTEGATARGVEPQVATAIFDLMEKFAGYGFNKSHSAAYALVAYQTAWLKAHYPAAFMAAVISADLDNTDKVVIFIHECEAMTLQVHPPSINHSAYAFTVENDCALRYGLGAIKGVGESAIQCLMDERDQHGSYHSLFDLCKHLDLRKMNRRVLEALIKSGAMDEWGMERSSLHASIAKAIHIGTEAHEQESSKQTNLFDLLDDEEPDPTLVSCKPWNTKERLEGEKETLGFYLTGHPADPYLQEFRQYVKPIRQLNPAKGKKVIVCGLIVSVRRILTKRGKMLAIIRVEDKSGGLDVVAFSETFEPQSVHVMAGHMLVIEGELGQDDYTGGLKMTAMALHSLEEARTRFATRLALTLTPAEETLLPVLQSILKAHPGRCVVQILYENDTAKAAINLALEWRVGPSDALMSALIDLLGMAKVELCY